MLTIADKNKALPRGSKYKDPHSGMDFPHSGLHIYSWESLLRQIKTHRIACDGDLDIGWEMRVEHEFCEQNPSIRSIHYAPSKDLTITVGDMSRFGYSLKTHILNGAKNVPQEEANRRAEICMKCPMRIESGICSGCNNLLSFFDGVIFGKKSTPYDDRLGNCGVCKCYNKISVHWPLEAQSIEGINPEDFPDFCWKRGA
jgi:hypothetical protein